ncbi:TerD family protein [bacterium]|nr:TerD family protein [bacterium]
MPLGFRAKLDKYINVGRPFNIKISKLSGSVCKFFALAADDKGQSLGESFCSLDDAPAFGDGAVKGSFYASVVDFKADLSRTSAKSVVFGFYIDGPKREAESFRLEIYQDGPTLLQADFAGAEGFKEEKAAVLLSLYFKDGWRLARIGQGFGDGIDGLCRQYKCSSAAAAKFRQACASPAGRQQAASSNPRPAGAPQSYTAERGFRCKLEEKLSLSQPIDVKLSIAGTSVYDFSCFGVDKNNKLSDDRYMIFYNQLASPNREITLSLGEKEARFSVTPAKLPNSIEKLVFTASIDGAGSMNNIVSHDIAVSQNGRAVFNSRYAGGMFQAEKAIISLEIYKKDVWRVNFVGQGFDGGLSELLKHYGGEEIQAAPAPAAASAKPVSAPVRQNPAAAPRPAPMPAAPPPAKAPKPVKSAPAAPPPPAKAPKPAKPVSAAPPPPAKAPKPFKPVTAAPPPPAKPPKPAKAAPYAQAAAPAASYPYGQAMPPAPTPVSYGQAPAPTPVPYGQAMPPAPTPVSYGRAPAPTPVPYGQAPAPTPVPYGQSMPPAPTPVPYGQSMPPAPTPVPYGQSMPPAPAPAPYVQAAPSAPYGQSQVPSVNAGAKPIRSYSDFCRENEKDEPTGKGFNTLFGLIGKTDANKTQSAPEASGAVSAPSASYAAPVSSSAAPAARGPVCPVCGAKSLGGTRFCEDCGTPLPEEGAGPAPAALPSSPLPSQAAAAAQVSQRAPIPAVSAPASAPSPQASAAAVGGKTVCASCGSLVRMDRFCDECGAELKAGAPGTAASVSPPAAPPAAAAVNKVVCPVCSCLVRQDKYCEECGSEMASAAAPGRPIPAAPQAAGAVNMAGSLPVAARGSRSALSQFINPNKPFSVEFNVAGGSGCDFACLVLNAQSKLINDQYCVGSANSVSQNKEIDSRIFPEFGFFNVNLSALPASAERLLFVTGVKNGSASALEKHSLIISQDGTPKVVSEFAGRELGGAVTVLAAALERKGGNWEIFFACHGYNDNFAAFLACWR